MKKDGTKIGRRWLLLLFETCLTAGRWQLPFVPRTNFHSRTDCGQLSLRNADRPRRNVHSFLFPLVFARHRVVTRSINENSSPLIPIRYNPIQSATLHSDYPIEKRTWWHGYFTFTTALWNFQEGMVIVFLLGERNNFRFIYLFFS